MTLVTLPAARADGVERRVGFVGPASERLYTVVTTPPAPTDRAVVICPPVMTDLLANYRSETLLAERLARGGIASIRFHYRGSGHSDGAQEQLDFPGMRVDAREAHAALTRAVGPAERPLATAFVGTRIGAVVAAAAAADLSVPRLVAWEPVLEPETFFREAIRMRFLREVVAGNRGKDTMRTLFERLREDHGTRADGNDVDVLGYRLTPRLFGSLVGERFADHLGHLARVRGRALLVALGTGEAYLDAFDEAAAGAERQGLAITTRRIATAPNWWLTESQRDPDPALVEASGDWLIRALDQDRAR